MSTGSGEPFSSGASEAETVVVGAGILGLSTALTLGRAGRDVMVIDRGQPWQEASAVNAGTLALQNKNPALLDLFRPALEEWRTFASTLDIDYVRRGGIRVASAETDVATLQAGAEAFAGVGVDVEWLEGRRLRCVAPWLAPTIVAATYCPVDGFASPLPIGRLLIQAIRRAKGRVEGRAALKGATRTDSGFTLTTARGEIRCENVVIATGPWSSKVAELFGVALPMSPRINILSVTERLPQFMDNLVVTHAAGRFTLKQFPNGSCILGGGFPGRGSQETGQKDVDHEPLVANVRFQCEVVPTLKKARLLRAWAGFTGTPTDDIPAIGAFASMPGLFAAVSTDAGFSAGPYVGRLVGEAVLGRPLPGFCARFSPDRFRP